MSPSTAWRRARILLDPDRDEKPNPPKGHKPRQCIETNSTQLQGDIQKGVHASIPKPKDLMRQTQRHSDMRLREAVVFAYMCEYGLFKEGRVSCTVFTVVSCTLLLCNLASVASAVVFEYILNEDTLVHVAAACRPPVRIGLLVRAVNACSRRALLLLTRLTETFPMKAKPYWEKSTVRMPVYQYCIAF